MSVQSMTGFGKAETKYGETQYSFEIRSLNSKQFDLNCRVPFRFRSREMEVRSIIGDILIRGKIDVFIQKRSGVNDSTSIDTELINKYYNDILPVFTEVNVKPDSSLISSLLRLPDVIKNSDDEPGEEEWKIFRNGLTDAANKLVEYRIDEGKSLEKDLISHLEKIENLTDDVIPMGSERIPQIRQRLTQSINEWSQNAESDKNRLEQELAFYLEKIDFNEEITRLRHHCTYFRHTLNEVNPGKKLGFIAQELGREINTLGSKAYHSGIQKKVVEMKDELEKIKEQLLNTL